MFRFSFSFFLSGGLVWTTALVAAYIGTELLGEFIIGANCNLVDDFIHQFPSVFGGNVTRCAAISAEAEYGIYVIGAAYCVSLMFVSLMLSAALWDSSSSPSTLPPLWMRATDALHLTQSRQLDASYMMVNDFE